jgi:iron complex outermembrane receptor protein
MKKHLIKVGLLSAILSPGLSAQEIEEVVVTARQQAESLQDVPVTIAAMTEADLDRYNITNLVDAAKMVPNMVIAQGASGNGSNLRLRGIGSSSISAAFDHSVAINVDGVVVNRGRFIHNSYMDMRQIEVLKGPQSLYFGKSATAGVVSIATNDPGDEFEFQIRGGIENEHEGSFGEVILSGPLSDNLGARLAVGMTKNDELRQNYSYKNDPVAAINGAHPAFGDESLNARLTLVWNPTDDFEAKLKYSVSQYESDGGTMWQEDYCVSGSTPEPTAVPAASAVFALFQAADNCKIDGDASNVYLNPALRAGLPMGYDNGVEGLDQDTDFMSLTMTWDPSDKFTITSVTGWVDLNHWELDDYSGGAGVFGGLHNNIYKSLSQEFRLASSLDGPLNFQFGFYWQDMEQEFDAYQYAFNLGVLFGPDPVTGNQYDYNKHHFLDTDVKSAFLALYWDLSEKTEVTLGARWTQEEKVGRIEIPYLHAFALAFGFGAPELIEGLDFDDTNVSPEFAINHYLNDSISVFAAYKKGFKSGGIDNSALPTASLNSAAPGFQGFGFLQYKSEEAAGQEVGLKARLLDDSLQLNATAFSYEYTDLQVQLFDSTNIQFKTFNASALETQGFEFDALFNTDIEGLTLRTAWAWTDTVYSKDFINATGENLKGQDGAGSADVAGYVGFSLDRPLNSGWRFDLSADARYTGEYAWTATSNPFIQDGFWVMDAAVRLYSEDERHELALIARNLADEIYIIGGGAIPGRCPNPTLNTNPAIPLYAFCDNSGGPNGLDQAANTPLGRTLTLQYRFKI